jgi:hypothetical protein
MQYSIMSRFGIFLDDDTPSRSLLYFYATLKKDEREEEQAQKNRAKGAHQSPALKMRMTPR